MPDLAASPNGAGAGLCAVPVGARWLLHSPSTGASALVNSAAVRQLAGGAAAEALGLAELTAAAPAESRDAADLGYRPPFLGLIPTRGCNLGCRYCGFRAGAAGTQQMPMPLAVTAIEWFAADCIRRGEKTLDVHLFGGEPLVARDVVDVIVHRTRAVAARDGLVPHLETATNGVYPNDTARFVADYFDVVVLSLDGPPAIHDRHRCRPNGSSSYAAVAETAKLLSASLCDLILRVCVSNENVDGMAETVRWFCDRFEPSALDFEPLQPTSDSAAARLAPPEALRFARGFVEAREEGDRHGVQVSFSGSVLEDRNRFCPAQNDGLIVSPDGRIGSCYLLEADWRRRGMDLNIGCVTPGGLVRIDAEATRRVRELADPQARCTGCFCQASCRGGCRVNHSCPEGTGPYDDFCIETRLITAALLLRNLDAAELGRDLVVSVEARRAFLDRQSDRLCDWRGPA
jgi:uncharacterized protein